MILFEFQNFPSVSPLRSLAICRADGAVALPQPFRILETTTKWQSLHAGFAGTQTNFQWKATGDPNCLVPLNEVESSPFYIYIIPHPSVLKLAYIAVTHHRIATGR